MQPGHDYGRRGELQRLRLVLRWPLPWFVYSRVGSKWPGMHSWEAPTGPRSSEAEKSQITSGRRGRTSDPRPLFFLAGCAQQGCQDLGVGMRSLRFATPEEIAKPQAAGRAPANLDDGASRFDLADRGGGVIPFPAGGCRMQWASCSSSIGQPSQSEGKPRPPNGLWLRMNLFPAATRRERQIGARKVKHLFPIRARQDCPALPAGLCEGRHFQEMPPPQLLRFPPLAGPQGRPIRRRMGRA